MANGARCPSGRNGSVSGKDRRVHPSNWVRSEVGQAGNLVEASSGFNPWVCLDWLDGTVMAARLRVRGGFREVHAVRRLRYVTLRGDVP